MKGTPGCHCVDLYTCSSHRNPWISIYLYIFTVSCQIFMKQSQLIQATFINHLNAVHFTVNVSAPWLSIRPCNSSKSLISRSVCLKTTCYNLRMSRSDIIANFSAHPLFITVLWRMAKNIHTWPHKNTSALDLNIICNLYILKLLPLFVVH